MKPAVYRVDAFTGPGYQGNPAAVCPLESWLEPETMQALALQNNLSETAFFVRKGDGYDLRWFTPACEANLCGHATLASAFVIFERLDPSADLVRFRTRSGELRVRRRGDLLTLDFPARTPERCKPNAAVAQALGRAPAELWAARDYMAVYETEEEVRGLAPDMRALTGLDRLAVSVTAPGRACDFVSRFFAPARGVNEDPVTGSAHCMLTPYWAQRLGKTDLHAVQLSSRGGELWCEAAGDRVHLSGRAVFA